jgi:CRP-like cAMP-binding protein
MDPDAHPLIFRLLKQGGWFGGLPAALQRLILQESTVRTYRKGQVIVREGEPTKGMFAVLEGRIRGVRAVGDGGEVLLHVGEAGFWFGYYSLFHRRPSVGSIVADTQVRVLHLPPARFERIVADEPRYYREFADLALEHYAMLFKYVVDLPGLRPEDRLRVRLADIAAVRRRDRPSHGPVSVNVSQSDLASMLGVSRQTLSALLGQLQTRGLIEVGFRSIRVLDEARLRERDSGSASGNAIRPSAAPTMPDARVQLT